MMQWVRTSGYKALFDTITRINLVISWLGLCFHVWRMFVLLLLMMLLKWSEVKFACNNFFTDQRVMRKRGKGYGVGLLATDLELEVVEFMKQ